VARSSILAGLPRFQRGGFWLLVLAAAASAVLADQPVAAALLLGEPFARDLALWQPLSAVLLFPDGRLGGLVGTLLLQWFVGGHVEARWGTARYLTCIVGAAVAGYLALGLLGLAVPAAVAVPQGGTVPADVAAVVAFGVVFGRQPVQLFGALPVSARALAGLVVGLELVAPAVRGAWPQAVPAAVAAALALLVALRWRPRTTSGKVAPRGRPRHLRVVDRPAERPKLLN
jgi:membrane associated rhomboid family serine protease